MFGINVKGMLTGLASNVGEKVVSDLIKKYATKENIKGAIDGILDWLEDYAAKTKTTADDEALLAIRTALDIPDNDNVTEKPSA